MTIIYVIIKIVIVITLNTHTPTNEYQNQNFNNEISNLNSIDSELNEPICHNNVPTISDAELCFLKFFVKILADDIISRKKASYIFNEVHKFYCFFVEPIKEIILKYKDHFTNEDSRLLASLFDPGFQQVPSEHVLFKKLTKMGVLIKGQ